MSFNAGDFGLFWGSLMLTFVYNATVQAGYHPGTRITEKEDKEDWPDMRFQQLPALPHNVQTCLPAKPIVCSIWSV